MKPQQPTTLSPSVTPRQYLVALPRSAASLQLPASQSFFCRSAQDAAPELIGYLLIRRQAGGELLEGVIVEIKANIVGASVAWLA